MGVEAARVCVVCEGAGSYADPWGHHGCPECFGRGLRPGAAELRAEIEFAKQHLTKLEARLEATLGEGREV